MKRCSDLGSSAGRTSWLPCCATALVSLCLLAQARASDEGTLAPTTPAGSEQFGCAVALDGDLALVGARFAELDGLTRGAAYVTGLGDLPAARAQPPQSSSATR